MFGRSLFSIIKGKRREKFGFVTLFITGICICVVAFFMFAEGFGSSRIDVYRQMAGRDTVNLEEFQTQTEKGNYEVSWM